jgi:branched-chain amino acid transport system permease protein
MMRTLLGARTRVVLSWALFATVLLTCWAGVSNDYYLRLMMVAAIYMAAAIPFGLLTGHMGYLAMGQAAFFGLGAYVVGNLTVLRFEQSFWLALAVATVLTAGVAYALSFPLFRLRGYHFAIGTLGVGQLAYLLYCSWEWLTGGSFGTTGVPPPAIGGFELDSNSRLCLLGMAALFVSALASWLLVRGRFGLALRAIRQDEDLAAARGLDVLRCKQLTFVFAATFSGVAGALYAPMQVSFDPSSFTIWSSFEFIIYVIVGGSGTLFGPALGVAFVVTLGQLIQDFGKWNQAVFGVLMVATVLFFRGGLWGGAQLLLRHAGRALARLHAADAPVTVAAAHASAAEARRARAVAGRKTSA